MTTSSIRILVAEDFEPFRKFLSSTLQNRPQLQIICEVGDGLEAVHKAEELQLGLILLDIGLPTVNGIEAARRIREVSPKSKIVFMSQESSTDVVQEAFNSGATEFVVKADAGSELLTAVTAVLRDERFVGRRFAGYDFTGTSDPNMTLESVRRNEVLARIEEQNVGTTRRHEVRLYSEDEAFLDGFADFIAAELKVGKAVILIATQSHQSCLFQRLQASGVDVAAIGDRPSHPI
jgi:DNA-binding NarL/FixJ family response regulator